MSEYDIYIDFLINLDKSYRLNRGLYSFDDTVYAVGFTPADTVKDAADFVAVKDTFTGEKMNRLVLALTILMPEIGDKLIYNF